MTIDPSIVVAAVGAAALVIGTTITALVTRRSHRDTDMRADLADLRHRLDASERRERIRDDYIHQLRTLLDEAGEDVPPWPDGLTTT
ncbi:hypothetical protein [Cellulomonas sp. RIT-PI-Y]|uniref:hypothetical protein n=1 Tax=Cellulomonas sp. RIT-PI-Y TaxID=3035297 RepID=UPI0021DA775A|nr:hypothetical protein [Cellulomonas sp. RIT-PI-Y]